MRTKTAIIKIHPWNGRRKIISSRTKTGWLVNPCRHLSQHANSRLEWLAGTIAQGLLVRATCYSSGHDHVPPHACTGRENVWSHPTWSCTPLDSRVLHAAALNGYRATIRRRAYRDFVSWLLSTSLKNTRVLQHVKYCLCQTRPLPPKEKVERFLVATLQRFVRWYLFARSSRPLLLRLCKSILKTGRGRGSWNDTTSVFPRNSRATFRSLYGVRNFWGACRSRGFVEGNTLRFFFERFDRFNNCWYRWT